MKEGWRSIKDNNTYVGLCGHAPQLVTIFQSYMANYVPSTREFKKKHTHTHTHTWYSKVALHA